MKPRCPFPGCERELSGPTAAYCFDHHVAADPKLVRQIIRLKIDRGRRCDPAIFEHLDEVIGSLTNKANRGIKEKVHA